MKNVPSTWDDVKFIDGYPGKYVVLARRHGDKWYVAGVNAMAEPVKLKLQLPMLSNGTEMVQYSDDKDLQGQVKQVKYAAKKGVQVSIPGNGGFVCVADAAAASK